MLYFLIWLVYGLIVGSLAKAIHPGNEASGFLPTIGIGIVGSYMGGLINWLLGAGGHPLTPSGLFMGVVGGVLFCWLYNHFELGSLLNKILKNK